MAEIGSPGNLDVQVASPRHVAACVRLCNAVANESAFSLDQFHDVADQST